MASVLRSATLSIDDNKGVMIVVADTLDKDMIDRETNMMVIHDTISDMLQKTVQINVRCLDKDKESMSDVVDLTKIIKVPIQYE